MDEAERASALAEAVRVRERLRDLRAGMHGARQADPHASLSRALMTRPVVTAHSSSRCSSGRRPVELEDLDDVGVSQAGGEAEPPR